MEIGTDQRVVVSERSQVSAVRHLATQVALQAGCDAEDAHRAGLVATELGTNLVKHAGRGGEILVSRISGLSGSGVQLRSLDTGPGIESLGAALADGYSSAGTPGTGLGAIRRLSNLFDIYSVKGLGTAVLARVAARGSAHDEAAGFEAGGVCVPHPGETISGDLASISAHGDRVIVALADGLGHGAGAHEAAKAALAALPANGTTAGPSDLLAQMHAATRHTRGSALSVACLRTGARVLNFAGVGNVAGLVAENGVLRHLVSSNGTLGHQVRAFQEFQYGWAPQSRLIMHSDGLSSSWTLDRHVGLLNRHPALVASVLYRDFSRHRDDATVIVVQERR
jgi:anti-sigma regulatory factor (Ser/Thr protein kinase)